MKENIPENANEHCPGAGSEEAGKVLIIFYEEISTFEYDEILFFCRQIVLQLM